MQEDVFGLQIAVHYARAMGGRQRPGDRPQVVKRSRGGQDTALSKLVGQGVAVEALEHDERHAVVAQAAVEHVGYVGVPDLRGQPAFQREAMGSRLLGGELDARKFERDLESVVRSLGSEDHAHSAASQHGRHAVASPESRPQSLFAGQERHRDRSQS